MIVMKADRVRRRFTPEYSTKTPFSSHYVTKPIYQDIVKIYLMLLMLELIHYQVGNHNSDPTYIVYVEYVFASIFASDVQAQA